MVEGEKINKERWGGNTKQGLSFRITFRSFESVSSLEHISVNLIGHQSRGFEAKSHLASDKLCLQYPEVYGSRPILNKGVSVK